jgi:L-ascorbate metabolism protein UlaG (beta-lactamase superfamily)
VLGRSRGRLRPIDGWRSSAKPNHRPDLSDWERHELAAAWVGHATVLLRVGGVTVLTDPAFSSRVGPGLGPITLGPRRLLAPAVTLSDLPAIDVILLSHAHFDHLDRPTLARLPKRSTVVTSEHNADLVRDLGFADVRELRWSESLQIGRLTVRAQRVAHWGARTVYDRHRGYAGFVLDAQANTSTPDVRARRVLYGADSAFGRHFQSVGPVDLAVIGIGAYDPWIESHANPEQAWQMCLDAQARRVLAMHHSTFELSREPADEPLRRFLAAAGERASDIVIQHVGQQWSLPTTMSPGYDASHAAAER